MKEVLSGIFAAIALTGAVALGQSEGFPDGAVTDVTVLKTAALQNAATVEGAHHTENGLTARDYTLDNPYDLAPALKIVTDAIEDEMGKLENGQILVVLSGEHHFMPAHKMTHIGILSHLVRKRDENPGDLSRRFLFATEKNANYLGMRWQILRLREEGLDEIPPAPEKLYEYDPDYRLAARAEAADSIFDGARQSEEKLSRYALRHDVPVIFNDADIERARVLDVRKEFNRQAYEDVRSELQWKGNRDIFFAFEADGVAIRNRVMVRRSMERARETGAGIIFQKAGVKHVFGDEDVEMSYLHSLAAQYWKEGARVLVVLPSFSDRFVNERISSDAWKDFPGAIVFRGLSDEQFSFGGEDGETAFIRRLVDSYSGGAAPFAADDPVPDKQAVDAELKRIVERAARPSL